MRYVFIGYRNKDYARLTCVDFREVKVSILSQIHGIQFHLNPSLLRRLKGLLRHLTVQVEILH